MGFGPLSGAGDATRVLAEFGPAPTLALAEELAPPADAAGAVADGRAGGAGRPDIRAQAAAAFTLLAEALESGMDRQTALPHLRSLAEVQADLACMLGRRYRDAEAAAEEARARLEAAEAMGAPLGGLRERVQRARAEWMERALAAQAATDVASGGHAALDCHGRSEMRRRKAPDEDHRRASDLEWVSREP